MNSNLLKVTLNTFLKTEILINFDFFCSEKNIAVTLKTFEQIIPQKL